MCDHGKLSELVPKTQCILTRDAPSIVLLCVVRKPPVLNLKLVSNRISCWTVLDASKNVEAGFSARHLRYLVFLRREWRTQYATD
jgi:hypothetical protein